MGESLTMIGKLLGHTQVQTTARYAHLARDSIQNAAARITGSIGGNKLSTPLLRFASTCAPRDLPIVGRLLSYQ